MKIEPDDKWNGYVRHNFFLKEQACYVVEPAISAPGRPWVWRTSFPDFHLEVDMELLRMGWHVGYIDCISMLGSDPSLALFEDFYREVRNRWKLAVKPALEAVSRGGLHAYRYAARHPEQIACIYADTPVMDLKSWPTKWHESQNEKKDAMKWYAFSSEDELQSFRGNPLDLLHVIAQAKIPLRHIVSLDDIVVPPEENTLEAKRRLSALGHEMELVEVAHGTEESKGHHFPLIEVFESARFIARHSQVMPVNREYFELRSGLKNAYDAFVRKKTGRVVFLGGSITYNPGWRDETMRYLQQKFPQTRFDFISTGIPSLGSVPHAFRLERDVLSRGPVDLLFVEAAVNDHNYDEAPNRAELALRGMEGVVRHMRIVNPATDIVQMHFVHDVHFKSYEAGAVPYTIDAHEKVARCYGNVSLDLSREVFDRIKAGEMTWAGDFKDLHPSPYGQQLYADSIARMLDAAFADAASSRPAPHVLPERPLDQRSYYHGRFGDLKQARLLKGISLDPCWDPADGMEVREGFVNVPALTGKQAGDEFEYEFSGTAFGLFVNSGPAACVLEYMADEGEWITVDTFTPWSKALHLPWAVILTDGLSAGKHKIRIRIAGVKSAGRGTFLCATQILING